MDIPIVLEQMERCLGAGSKTRRFVFYETAEQCDAAADQLKQRGDDININAWARPPTIEPTSSTLIQPARTRFRSS